MESTSDRITKLEQSIAKRLREFQRENKVKITGINLYSLSHELQGEEYELMIRISSKLSTLTAKTADNVE